MASDTAYIQPVNLADAFASFSDHWNPRIAAQVNDFALKVVKLQGEFLWHHHETEDELFLVVKGRLTIRLRDRDLHLGEGEMVVIPHGVEHMPMAEEEAHILLFEPAATLNTGNVENERTVREPKQVT
jgi:mannose-6-phosphate isomerase-like protein (cupin superfamily)